MNGSVAESDSKRPASITFLRVLAYLALALAATEFFLAVHYNREKVAAETANLSRNFQNFYYNSYVWENTKWLGVEAEQTPTDNWGMQEIISELKPDYIIESGTFNGGSTLFYATILSYVNPNGKVITIDIDPHIQAASQWPLWNDRVELLIGSSVEPRITDHIAAEVAGKKVLVTLDSLHTRDHVLKEMEIYSKLVPVGSYMVVQDTNINGHPVLPDFGPGPNEAVQEFLQTHNEFVVDRSRENFFLTFYPGGWLKRVR